MTSPNPTLEALVEAARTYRAAVADCTPRMWHGKALQDLADKLDNAIARYDAASETERPHDYEGTRCRNCGERYGHLTSTWCPAPPSPEKSDA